MVALTPDREPVEFTERGALTDAVRARVSRPYQYTHEDTIYGFTAWEGHDGEHIVSGYRVVSQPNPKPYVAKPTLGPPQLDQASLDALAMDGDEVVQLNIVLRDFPAWDVPLMPHDSAASLAQLASRTEARKQALAARAATFEKMAAGVVSAIQADGGRIVSKGTRGGWLLAEVSVGTLKRLSQRNDLLSITNLTNGTFRAGWTLGDGRVNDRLDVNRFHNAGYTGGRSNPGRHSFGNITLAVIEPDGLEDEACFLYDEEGCTGTSRLVERFDCDDADTAAGDDNGNYCQPTTGFSETDESDHGTKSAALALGDYMDGQGDGLALGDDGWTGNPASCTTDANCTNGARKCSPEGKCEHTSVWEQRSTGMAPEASLIYFGEMNGDGGAADTTAAFADAFDDSIDRSVDITSNSWGWMPGPDTCNPAANLAFEIQAENAFDDGILNVACAGNFGLGSCLVWAPGAIPKVLAVNGLDTSPTACHSDYNGTCLIDPGGASEGGADVKTNGLTNPRAAALVDLAAPTNIDYSTFAFGNNGEVDDVVGGLDAGGCSSATPQVAGMAALVKDWYLGSGNTWINDPGILQTVMLSMGDRHAGAAVPTSQKVAGADNQFGMGRAKLRLLNGTLGNSWNSHSNWTFVPSSSTVTTAPFGGPMHSNAVVTKCVLFQYEDTSADTSPPTISDLDLTLEVRATVGGACSASGTLIRTRQDIFHDWKSMVALESSDVTGGLGGRCLYVKIRPFWVESSAGISAHLHCYSAAIDDDDPT